MHQDLTPLVVRAMTALDMDRKQFAEALGVSQGALSNWFKGRTPSLDSFRKMADLIGYRLTVDLVAPGDENANIDHLPSELRSMLASADAEDLVLTTLLLRMCQSEAGEYQREVVKHMLVAMIEQD